MQVIANQKGASQKRLRCHFQDTSEQKVTLKDQFLKNSDEYVLTVENCFTNATPGIFLHDETVIRIRPKAYAGHAFPFQYPNNDPLQPYSEFKVGPKFKDGSIMGFVDRLREFIDIFNFKLYIHGADYFPVQPNIRPIIEANNPGPLANHDLHTYTDLDDVNDNRYISVGLTTAGNLQFQCSDFFLSNFYIEFSERFSRRTGFDLYIWMDSAGVRSNTANFTHINLAGGGHFTIGNMAVPVSDPHIWQATSSVFSLDGRLTIDVESTVPVFNTMTSEFSVEKQEHLLSRFVLPEYREISANLHSLDGLVVTDLDFEDEGESVTDLVRNPYCKVNAMRSGHIQAVNISLWVRYLVDTTLEKVRLTLGKNEWVDLGLLFSKRL